MKKFKDKQLSSKQLQSTKGGVKCPPGTIWIDFLGECYAPPPDK